jgi:RNA processing factor Prp31
VVDEFVDPECFNIPSINVYIFRALKTKGNTPKYGLIFHSTFIGRAGAKNKGRISRYLANKCSIASRIDCFTGTFVTSFDGNRGHNW